ncbi:exodeoxyribonuclease VII small subunit [Candidatus Uhrbacteria bacterium CG_4_9_14_3_um_filter_36_7]|uniref:Exodeoxyribonuclease 7 small subunit n=1 Tax=Candidatus Uhrbacteria bacterium CG_4_9_14_3_um_filter_36_7 TaxID=1975033 RepID=A0A2M7XGQ5_9BACT|nr:MAG: exodeoxyribonuclease VII small subunit [Candidatus Uhrbacteria bacterium CG_4_9_14_3_um_filter_36_7]
MSTAKKNPVLFAKAFEELEAITAWFEQEEIDLDEGLKKFERGLELASFCQKKLTEVENKVHEITLKFQQPSSFL